MDTWRPRLPGILLVVVVAAVCWAISWFVAALPAAPLALVLGWAAALTLGSRLATDPGVDWSGSRSLRVGVMLLGAALSLSEIVARGADAIPVIILALVCVFAGALLIGRLMHIPFELRLLMGAGIGICGNSAIAAVAPIARASQQQIAAAVAMITVFGTAAVLVYPVIGAAMGLSADDYGLWSGIAIADTAQVVAAAFAAGPDAGEVATITKLTRNAFLGPVVLIIAAQSAHAARAGSAVPVRLLTAIPPFVIGFLALAALRSLGVIGETVGDGLAVLGGFAILLGLVGIGYGLKTTHPGRSDVSALALGFGIMTAVSVVTLIAVIAT